MRNSAEAQMGDTFCHPGRPVQPQPGFKPTRPMVSEMQLVALTSRPHQAHGKSDETCIGPPPDRKRPREWGCLLSYWQDDESEKASVDALNLPTIHSQPTHYLFSPPMSFSNISISLHSQCLDGHLKSTSQHASLAHLRFARILCSFSRRCMFVVLLLLTLSLPRVINCQSSPIASPEILHHTVWRTWLFVPYSDKRWLYYQCPVPGECTFWA